MRTKNDGGATNPGVKQSSVKRTKPKPGSAISLEEFLALKNPKGDLKLEIEGEQVSLTSLERIYWPDEKITKFEQEAMKP